MSRSVELPETRSPSARLRDDAGEHARHRVLLDLRRVKHDAGWRMAVVGLLHFTPCVRCSDVWLHLWLSGSSNAVLVSAPHEKQTVDHREKHQQDDQSADQPSQERRISRVRDKMRLDVVGRDQTSHAKLCGKPQAQTLLAMSPAPNAVLSPSQRDTT